MKAEILSFLLRLLDYYLQNFQSSVLGVNTQLFCEMPQFRVTERKDVDL